MFCARGRGWYFLCCFMFFFVVLWSAADDKYATTDVIFWPIAQSRGQNLWVAMQKYACICKLNIITILIISKLLLDQRKDWKVKNFSVLLVLLLFPLFATALKDNNLLDEVVPVERSASAIQTAADFIRGKKFQPLRSICHPRIPKRMALVLPNISN
jgi:hypothetical protein